MHLRPIIGCLHAYIQSPPLPEGVSEVRWRIEGFGRRSLYTPTTRDINNLPTSYVVSDLSPDTPYRVRVRTDVRYPFCNGYLWGDFSDFVEVRTTESGKNHGLEVNCSVSNA